MSAATGATGNNWLSRTFTGASSVTLCGWVKVDNWGKGTAFGNWLSLSNPTSGNAPEAGFDQDDAGNGTGSNLTGYWFNTANSGGGNVATSVALSTWYFLAVVVSGTTNATVDFYWGTETGALSHSQLTSNYNATNLNTAWVGSQGDGVLNYPNSASYREVKLWVGSALNATQILAERDAGSNGPVITTNLDSYLKTLSGTSPETAALGTSWTRTGTLTAGTSDPAFPATPLLLYLMNEAASGTTPTSILDSAAGTAVNLPITYTGTSAWTSIGAGKGLTINGATGGGTWAKSASLSGGKADVALAGTTSCTLEFVVTASGTPANFEEVGGWNNPGVDDGVTLFRDNVSGKLQVWSLLNGDATQMAESSAALSSGLHVIHIVVDTTQATAANRVKIYVDGTDVTTSTSAPTQNSTLVVGARFFCLGDDPSHTFGTNMWNGTIWYAALYTVPMTSTKVSANSTALTSNNDANPNSSAGTLYDVSVTETAISTSDSTALSRELGRVLGGLVSVTFSN